MLNSHNVFKSSVKINLKINKLAEVIFKSVLGILKNILLVFNHRKIRTKSIKKNIFSFDVLNYFSYVCPKTVLLIS